jgi:hypothetical protein
MADFNSTLFGKTRRGVSSSSSEDLSPRSSSSDNEVCSTSASDKEEVQRLPSASKVTQPTSDTTVQNPIFFYFNREVRRDKDDKVIEVFAKCKVIVGGHPCGKKLAQPESSTTGPRNHLKRIHTKEWTQYQAIVSKRKETARGSKRTIDEETDNTESRPEKKIKTYSQPVLEVKNGVENYLKVQVRCKQQLRFDMAVTRYFVKCGLPFSHASQEGFREFVGELDKKFHIISVFLSSNK